MTNIHAFEIGAMIEPLSVGLHAVSLAGDVKGKNVLVLGAGVIGNLAAQVAAVRGANVMLAGRTAYRFDFAKQVGLKLCVNTDNEDLTEAVTKHFGADGADVVIEAVGVADAVNEAFLQCITGGTVVITGVFGEFQLIDLFTFQNKEIRAIGSMMYSVSEFHESISLVSKGLVKLEPLMTAILPAERFSEAFEIIKTKSIPVMKVLISI